MLKVNARSQICVLPSTSPPCLHQTPAQLGLRAGSGRCRDPRLPRLPPPVASPLGPSAPARTLPQGLCSAPSFPLMVPLPLLCPAWSFSARPPLSGAPPAASPAGPWPLQSWSHRSHPAGARPRLFHTSVSLPGHARGGDRDPAHCSGRPRPSGEQSWGRAWRARLMWLPQAIQLQACR